MRKITKHAANTTTAILLVFLLSNASEAAGTWEQRQACTQDAFKFCSNEIPNVPLITACMARNLKNLSPLCRAQFTAPRLNREKS
jgi:hypothetical protein